MNTHCYSVGERVLYTRQRISHLSWKAPYTVTRCLASDQMEPQYEIRSAHGAYQRLALEHELTRMAVPAQAFHPAEALSPAEPARLLQPRRSRQSQSSPGVQSASQGLAQERATLIGAWIRACTVH